LPDIQTALPPELFLSQPVISVNAFLPLPTGEKSGRSTISKLGCTIKPAIPDSPVYVPGYRDSPCTFSMFGIEIRIRNLKKGLTSEILLPVEYSSTFSLGLFRPPGLPLYLNVCG